MAQNEKEEFELCAHCNGDLKIRMPVPSSGCDHLYYPENCVVCSSADKKGNVVPLITTDSSPEKEAGIPAYGRHGGCWKEVDRLKEKLSRSKKEAEEWKQQAQELVFVLLCSRPDKDWFDPDYKNFYEFFKRWEQQREEALSVFQKFKDRNNKN